MSDGPGGPTTAELQTQLNEMQQRLLVQDLELARTRVYAQHPHLRDLGLLEQFQGSPEQIAQFGTTLAERFPAPAPTPAPLTQMPQVPGVPPVGQLPTSPGTIAVAPPQPAAPETSAVPVPSPQDVLPQQSADTMRADEIRERMAQGLATRQDVLWLSQYAPRREVDLGNGLRGFSGGFVSAARGLRPNG